MITIRIIFILYIAYVKNKTAFLTFNLVNPINNDMCISLFIGLAQSESWKVVLFYICNM